MTDEQRAREWRNRIAGEFHLSGQCGSDGGTFNEVLESGYECCCYEAADLMLPLLARRALEARAAECDSLRLFLHMSRDHIPMQADNCKFQICIDLRVRADSYLLAAAGPDAQLMGESYEQYLARRERT